ncbi:Acyl-CoA-binding domain-containing protein 5, partial [Perkinsus olseni]
LATNELESGKNHVEEMKCGNTAKSTAMQSGMEDLERCIQADLQRLDEDFRAQMNLQKNENVRLQQCLTTLKGWPDEFCAAVDYVGDHGEDNLDDRTRLELYGWYKQATIGDCDDATAKAGKWSAGARYYMTKSWEAKRGCTKEEAFRSYIRVLDDAKPDWREACDEEEDDNIWVNEPEDKKVEYSQEPRMVVGDDEGAAIDNSAAGLFC